MPAHRNNEKAAALFERYLAGVSLAMVAGEFGMSRQAVYKMLALRGCDLRSPVLREHLEWNGETYSLRDNGYFARTSGSRSYLHRDVYEKEFGPIPEGYDVHHVDEDKRNNSPDNLAIHTQAEHSSRHGFGGNQHTGSLGRRPVKW